MTPPFVVARHDSAEAISDGGRGFPRTFQVLAMTPPFVVARHDSAEAVPGTKNFPRLTPLTVRGAWGVREITPFIPLTLRGRSKGSPYFKGEI